MVEADPSSPADLSVEVFEGQEKLDEVEETWETAPDPAAVQTTPGNTQESFWTRLGVTPRSFLPRENSSIGHGELERTMSKRHLNMIAIGGSIGAGFFVGSGAALAKGVSPFLSLSFCR